jgi:MFS family permease
MENARSVNVKRNYTLGILNGTLVNFGLAFIDPFTVLPVFITRLGGSSFLIGLSTAAYSAGWFLPQVFVARYAGARPFVLGIYRAMSVFRIAAWVCVITVVFTVDVAFSQLFIWMVIACLFINTVCAGIAGIPFLEVASKTIPVQRRGSFFGLRRLSGGLLGILAGVIVAVVLGGHSSATWTSGWLYGTVEKAVGAAGLLGHRFPYNYGVLIVIGAVLSAIGLLLFGLIREPAATVTHPVPTLREHLSRGFSLLKKHDNYRLFFLVRVSWQFTSMAFPFYSAYAYKTLGFSESSVGVFVSIWVGSGVLSNYLWGKLADSRGNRIVLVVTALISLAPPLMILLLTRGSAGVSEGGPSQTVFWVVASTYLINGFARSGRFITNMTYLLEFAPEDNRPLYVGFMNSLSFPFMLSPALGGVVVQVFSFETLFTLSMGFAAINVVLSARLIEPRFREPAFESAEMS